VANFVDVDVDADADVDPESGSVDSVNVASMIEPTLLLLHLP